MTGRRSRASVASAVDRLITSTHDSRSLRAGVLSVLREVLGFDWYAWVLTDPATEVGVDPLADIPDLSALGRVIGLKYRTGVNRWTTLETVAHLPGAAADSPWGDALAAYGVIDVASAVFRDRQGCWAFLDLWSPQAYDDGDLAVVRDLLPALTAALRQSRARLFDASTGPAAEPGPTVLLVDDGLRVLGYTPTTGPLLRALIPTADRSDPIPAGALNVAAQLLANEAGADDHEPRARVHAPGRGLLTLCASRIDPGGQIAVSIEPATAREHLDFFARAHDLSPRERDVLDALATGADTAVVANALCLSPHTIQDHLKSVFDKTRTRSRRELLARALGAPAPGVGLDHAR